MRVYLCGQKHFGAAVLAQLLEDGHDVAGVSAPLPDKLAALADTHTIPTLPAGQLRAATLPPNVDLIIAAHSHDFISHATRLRATYGAIGYHPSLLPRHRGRDAIKWTIKLGDPITGGTVYWLSDTVDGGPIAAQDWCWVPPGTTATDLWRGTLQPMGLRLLRQALADIAMGTLVRIPQDDRMATWEPALDPPPLRRPDLILLGDGSPTIRVVTSRAG